MIKTNTQENGVTENPIMTSDATIILDILSSLPEDFMADGRKDPPPQNTQAEQFFINIP